MCGVESSVWRWAMCWGGMEAGNAISPACSADSAVEGSEMNLNVTPETFGAPPQYPGLALSVIESPLF